MNNLGYSKLSFPSEESQFQKMEDGSARSPLETRGHFGDRKVRSIGGGSRESIPTSRRMNEPEIFSDNLSYIKTNLKAIENYKGKLEREPQVFDGSSHSKIAKIIKFIKMIFEKLGLISQSASTPTNLNVVLRDLNEILSFYYKEFGKKLEAQMLSLAARTEEISNISKNLMDIYQLTVNEEDNVESIADDFIEALKKASNNQFESFQFKGKKVVVSDHNKSNLESLYKNFTGENQSVYREGLIEYLKGKKAQSEGMIHFPTPLQGPIKEIKTKKEAQIIGFYLMGEICKIKGGARIIELNKLDKLLSHSLVKNSPLLTEGVWSNAKEVTLQAIRKKQSDIVWESTLERKDKQKLQAELDKLSNKDSFLDFLGLKKLAEETGVKTDSFRSSEELEVQLTVLDVIHGKSTIGWVE